MTPIQLLSFVCVCVAAIGIGVMMLNDVFEAQDQRRRSEEIARRALQFSQRRH